MFAILQYAKFCYKNYNRLLFYTIKGDFIIYLCDFYNIICLRFYNMRNFVIKIKLIVILYNKNVIL